MKKLINEEVVLLNNIIGKINLLISDTNISNLSFELVKDNTDISKFDPKNQPRYLKIINFIKEKPRNISELSNVLKNEYSNDTNKESTEEKVKNDLSVLILRGLIVPTKNVA